MSTQVHRLQALLERVQENRAQPRASAPAATRAHAARGDGAPVPARAAPAQVQAQAARMPEPRPADRAKAGATPLEMAFEDQLSGAHAAPPAAQAAREAAAPFSPAAAASASPREGALLVDPPATQPSKPIVQVVSKHPPSVTLNFGELLRRSLSLRPR